MHNLQVSLHVIYSICSFFFSFILTSWSLQIQQSRHFKCPRCSNKSLVPHALNPICQRLMLHTTSCSSLCTSTPLTLNNLALSAAEGWLNDTNPKALCTKSLGKNRKSIQDPWHMLRTLMSITSDFVNKGQLKLLTMMKGIYPTLSLTVYGAKTIDALQQKIFMKQQVHRSLKIMNLTKLLFRHSNGYLLLQFWVLGMSMNLIVFE